MSKNYDLIVITHFFYPQVGGLERAAYDLISFFSKRGQHCLVIHGGARHKSTTGIFDQVTFPTFNVLNGNYPLFGPGFAFYLLRTLRANPNAKVLIYGRYLFSSLVAAGICKILQRSYVLVEQTAESAFLNGDFLNRLVRLVDRHIFGFVVKNARQIIAVSSASRKYIFRTFKVDPALVNVVHNGFEPSRLPPPNLRHRENRVVFAAKWIVVKDPQTTLDAFRILAQKYPDWEFWFVGKGKDVKIKKAKAYKRLKIVNRFLPQEELLSLLAKSKIYVNSSLSEGFSLGLIEAAAVGDILVVSDAPSNRELSQRLGLDDFVFQRGSVQDLVQKLDLAIARSLTVPQIHCQIAQEAQIFSNHVLLKKYEQELFTCRQCQPKIGSLSIIVPLYNEEKTVLETLRRLTSLRLGDVQKEIIIVDDGSTDQSWLRVNKFIKRQTGHQKSTIKVLRNLVNRGKSQSVKTGILNSTGDLVVVHDADLEYNPADLAPFIQRFQQDGQVDVIYGNRFVKGNQFLSPLTYWGNRFVTLLSNLLTMRKGVCVKDMEVCYKMIKGQIVREIAKTLESTSDFGIEPELTAKLANYRKRNGHKLVFAQIPITYKARTQADGKKLKIWRDGILTVGEILKFNLFIPLQVKLSPSFRFLLPVLRYCSKVNVASVDSRMVDN